MSNYEICQEMGQNFIDYAYAVNTDRSIPSAADGLKPVHRRILWSMYKEKNTPDKAHVKCARIVGDVIGKYHPHGDTSVYDAMTRLAQEWNVRYPLINWHGNKGNIGGDGAAAMRYTEARLEPLAQFGMLQNLNKNIVDMQPNYSEDLEEPVLLPALFPNLLCNPNSGIGVAMACNWLPYNLHEIINQIIVPHVKEETTDYESIAPDFPTGGDIINPSVIKTINRTGRGSIIVDGRYKIEQRNGHNLIVFYEIPYGTKIEYEDQGKPKGIIPQLRKAMQEEKLTDVIDIRDESSKSVRIVIEYNSSANVERIISQIYNETDLRKSFSANYVAIVGKTPTLLNMFEIIKIYSQHNLSCIKREFQFEYEKTISRIHILEALIWAVQHIDEVIKTIREGKDLSEIMNTFSDKQIKAILDMKLGRLSKLEEEKLIQEKKEKEEYAAYCKEIIESENRQKEILIERLRELDKKFGDNRRTHIQEKVIVKKTSAAKVKEIIIEDVMITYSNAGYIQSIPLKAYRTAEYKNSFKCQTNDMILLFSSLGKLYRLKVDAIKQCSQKDKGTAVGALLNLNPGEKILNIFSMNIDEKHPYIVGVTKFGQVKKSEKLIYLGSTQNKNGLQAAGLKDNDQYIGFWECNGDYMSLLTKNDMIIQFELEKVNPVGKTAKGVKGITLSANDYVVEAIVCNPAIDTIKIKKYNKTIKGITVQGRGGKGRKIA